MLFCNDLIQLINILILYTNIRGSKLPVARWPLATRFSKWPPGFRGWWPGGPPLSETRWPLVNFNRKNSTGLKTIISTSAICSKYRKPVWCVFVCINYRLASSRSHSITTVFKIL